MIAEGGQGSTTKRRAVDGIESVEENAPGAAIEEHTVREIGDP